MNIINKRNILYLLLGLVAVIVLVMNIKSLLGLSIRLDESQSVWFSTKPLGGIIQVSSEDLHMPLYYILLHFWIKLFGTSTIAIRSLSLLFFLMIIPLLYKLAREASNHRTAFLTIVLFIFSPFVIWFSTEARMYTLFIMVTTLNNIYFLRFARSSGQKGKLGMFISTVLGFYSHYFYTLVVLTQLTYLLFEALRRVRKKGLERFSLLIKYLFLIGGAALVFLPWMYLFVAAGAGSNSSPNLTAPTGFNIFQTYFNFFFGFMPLPIQSLLISLWPVVTLMLFVIFTSRKKIIVAQIPYFIMYLILPIIIGFVVSFVRPVFLPRYFIFITPVLFFLLAWSLVHIAKRSYSLVSIFSVFILLVFTTYQSVSAENPAKEDFRSVSEYLEEQVKPQDIIILTPPFTVYPMEYNYNGIARITTIPEWDRFSTGPIPQFSLSDLEVQIETYKQVYETMYVVFSYDQGYEEEIQQYLDSNLERLHRQNYASGIELRVYRLRYQ